MASICAILACWLLHYFSSAIFGCSFVFCAVERNMNSLYKLTINVILFLFFQQNAVVIFSLSALAPREYLWPKFMCSIKSRQQWQRSTTPNYPPTRTKCNCRGGLADNWRWCAHAVCCVGGIPEHVMKWRTNTNIRPRYLLRLLICSAAMSTFGYYFMFFFKVWCEQFTIAIWLSIITLFFFVQYLVGCDKNKC